MATKWLDDWKGSSLKIDCLERATFGYFLSKSKKFNTCSQYDHVIRLYHKSSSSHISSVTRQEYPIHVFFLPVRAQLLIMSLTVWMFSGYIPRDTIPYNRMQYILNPWHSHRHSFLVSPVGATPVMELNTLKIIPVGHPPNHLLPHLCRWQRWWGVIQ